MIPNSGQNSFPRFVSFTSLTLYFKFNICFLSGMTNRLVEGFRRAYVAGLGAFDSGRVIVSSCVFISHELMIYFRN